MVSWRNLQRRNRPGIYCRYPAAACPHDKHRSKRRHPLQANAAQRRLSRLYQGGWIFSRFIFSLSKAGLLGVVSESGGTGWAAQSAFTTIGGKTGTAQVVALKRGDLYLSERFRDHAWFVAFAPVGKTRDSTCRYSWSMAGMEEALQPLLQKGL